MGLILERSGMAEDLLDTIGQLFGPLRGGLAFAVIFVGALLAATTGVVAASVISMGLISLPIMLRYGYDRRFASGVIAASGTLAQIIPPSLVLIIMADQLGKSVGDMYAGAFIPGICLAGLYAAFTLGVSVFKPHWAPALPQRVYGVMSNDTLLAIPFFTFMGLILERSGMAEDLLDTIGQLFGTIRGGLAYAVIFVGALLAATTGVVAASVISMGLISLPIMLRYGYDRRAATGIIAASGTLAQIIPPSLVLIIMADQLGRSVGDMYEGAFVPGLVLALLYAVYAFALTIIAPNAMPGLPAEDLTYKEPDGTRGVWSLAVVVVLSIACGYLYMRTTNVKAGADFVVLTMSLTVAISFAIAVVNRVLRLKLLSVLAEQVIFVMVPPLALIFLVLGTIFVGVATPTEGGAMGAAGALLLAIIKRRLSWDLTRQATESTAKLSAFVVFILIGARVFSLTFYGVDGHKWVEEIGRAHV